jgi:hypothetical protein
MRRALLAACLLALLVAAAPASAKTKSCPKKAGTVAKNTYGRLWHQKGSLYGCSTVYARPPRSVRLGPWRGGNGPVAWDGIAAAWTTPRVVDGVRSDRVWVASLDSGKRWLSGARAVPPSGSTPGREARVTALVADFEGVAWATDAGDAVLALHDPQADPTAVGTLPAPLAAAGKELLVGSWPSAATDVASSLALTSTSEDGDECGGVDLYKLAVKPDPATDAVGATWDGGWERTHCG